MASAKFYLKDKTAEKTSIQMHFHFDGQKVKLGTGLVINSQQWNPKTQRAKTSKLMVDHVSFNGRLSQLEKGAEDIHRKFLLETGMEPLKDELKERLETVLLGKNKPERITLHKFIDDFIEYKAKVVKPATIKVYKTTRKHLETYEKKARRTLDFKDVDLSFYDKFVAFLVDDLAINLNSRSKYISTVSAFMNEAFERGYHENQSFKKFKAPRKPAHNIYLGEQEISKIYELNLGTTQGLDKVRDLFVIGCYTGLRFSDYTKLETGAINAEQGILTIHTRKTEEVVSIPLHYRVKEILAKYSNTLPESISNQKTNSALKKIGELAGLVDKESVVSFEGGKRIITPTERYKLIKTHTARRSFATNAYLAKVPVLAIMKITGHKTEREFMKYIKVSSQENAISLTEHAFFTGEREESRTLKIAN